MVVTGGGNNGAMLVFATLAIVLLTLSALAALCDRWGPADPAYPVPCPLEVAPVRCPGPVGGRTHARRGRSDVA